MNDSCNNCRFSLAEPKTPLRTCRRRAPRAFSFNVGKPVDKCAHWPMVEPSDWCGEHELIRITPKDSEP